MIILGNFAPVTSAYSWSDGSSVVGTTNPLAVTVNATSTYTCTATITNGCPITASVLVTALALPSSPTASNSSQCGTTIPTASVADPNGFTTPTFKWYDAASAGTLLQSSTSTTYTSNIAVTTTFYVSVINPTTNCESARSPVTVMVSTAPTLTITASQTVCNNEIVELNITSTIADYDVYTWTPNTYLFTDAAATVAYTGTGNPSIVYFKSATGAANVITLNSSNTSSGCTNLTTSTVSVLPSSITASAAVSSFCLSGSTSVSVASIPAGATVQWQSSPDNATWTDIASATLATVATGTITSTTYYRLAVNKAGGVNCLYSNVVTVTVKQTMSGTYTVGAGGNYTSLTSAVADLACVGVSGAVVLSLTDAAYNSGETFPIVIPAVAGASATNTVTVRPANGVTSTISGTVASAALIKLNGADYVTIDGSNNGSSSRNLTITNTNTTSPTGISLSSLGAGAGATYNTIKNCNISTGVSAAAGYGIAIGGSTPGTDGADNDNVTIQNNVITIATIGIYADGLASVSATGMDNLLISGNTITTNTTIQTQGIQVGYGLNGSITGNTISVTTSGDYQPVGISLETGFVSSSVTLNKITQVVTTSTGGFGGRGITIGTGTATSALTIANNVIYGVNGSNWSSFINSSSMGIAIGVLGGESASLATTAGGISLYYNSVNMSGSYSYAAGCLTAALYVGSGASALDIENNIFMNALNNTNAGGTASKAYAIYSAIANTAYTKINYNDYVVSGSQGVLGFLSSDKTTIATWRTATAKDANSVNVTPNFTSATDLHLISSTNCGLDGMGTPISGITTDYDLDTRNATTPDIGADEFTSTFSASAGTGQSVCGTSVTLAASLSNGTGTWTPTAGLTYTPNTTTATAGVSGLTASNAGTATVFTWTITGAGSCNSALPVTITAYNPRTVNAGVDQTVCSSSPNVTLAGTKGGSASSSTVTWTTSGTGTFDNANSLTAVYTVSAADISAGSVTLTLTTDNTPGPCIAVSDQMVITINPRATANANIDQTVCAGLPDVTLAGSIGGSATTATWTGGTGTFNPDNTSLTAVYTPSAAEITAGTVTLTLTTDDPAGVCAAATDQMVITIRPSATANAGTDQSVCVSSPSVTLNGSIGGSALSGTWSGGIGTFTPDNTTLNAVYTPAAGENAAGMVITLTLTTAGPCAVTTDDMLISIHGNPDAPTGSAAQAFCTAGTIADLSATGTSIRWYAAATGGSAISSGTALVDGTTYYASQTVGICESITRLAVTVTLNPAATANAGTPQSICAGNTVTLAGTIGGGASSAIWSGGLGTFSPNATTLDAVYTPTAGEITAGAVTLTLTTDNPAGPCGAVTSNMTITISTNSGSLVSSAIPVCKTMSVGTGAVYTSGTCNIIDKVVPNGASPVSGVINSCVTIDATVQSYNSEPYLQRHFDITPSTNPLTSSARITLYVLQLEFDDFNLANSTYPDLPTGPSDAAGIGNLRITKYSGTGTAPGNYTPGVVTLIDPDDVDIVWNGSYWEISFDISGFSGFYIHTGYGNPLPLNLLNFGGYKDGSVNQLRWSTANEINSRGFEVQRSVDGIHYTAIGFVNSVAQNGTTNNYVYTDRAVVGDRQYYRLRQVDLDGHSKLSNIVLIRGDKLNVLQVQGLYPNPATSQINLLLSSPIQEKMQLQLMDITGRTVVQRWISVETGSNNIPVNISMLSSGSYLVKLLGSSSQETIVAKFVKQ
ncbi:MAG: T9SS type A sorting domain-containing protein [Actinomycetota bacterium]